MSFIPKLMCLPADHDMAQQAKTAMAYAGPFYERPCHICGLQVIVSAASLRKMEALGNNVQILCNYCFADLPEEELYLLLAPSAEALAVLSRQKGRPVTVEEAAMAAMHALAEWRGKRPASAMPDGQNRN